MRFLIKEKQKRDREAGREMNYKTKRAMGRLCYLFGEEFRVRDILYFLNKKIPQPHTCFSSHDFLLFY